jgi:hypothetical protein
MTPRTEAQKKALRDAYKGLSEQFDYVLIACATKADHEQESFSDDVYWKGGHAMGKTLVSVAKEVLQYKKRMSNVPRE